MDCLLSDTELAHEISSRASEAVQAEALSYRASCWAQRAARSATPEQPARVEILCEAHATGRRQPAAHERRHSRWQLTPLAAFEPRVLACMHGSSFAGDGRTALLELADVLERASADRTKV